MNCNSYNRQNGSVNTQSSYNRQNASANQNNYLRSPMYRNNSSVRPQTCNSNDNTAGEATTSCPCQNNGNNYNDMPVDDMTIGMSYVPWQQWGDVYDSAEALSKGTIFAELYKPWIGRSIGNE